MLLILFSSFSTASLFSPSEERAFIEHMKNSDVMFVGIEYHFRLAIFISNLRYIKEFNRKSTFKLGVNKLAHYTPSEYTSLLNFPNLAFNGLQQSEEGFPIRELNADVDNLDYREQGIVNPIQDQGNCGADWAFAAVSCEETNYALTMENTLLKFSEQNLIDCVSTNEGCNGGSVTNALQYQIDLQNHKLNLASDYPFEENQGNCRYNKDKARVVLKSFKNLKSKDEYNLKQYVITYGAVIAQIDANHASFQLYSSGIYEEPSCDQDDPNFAITIVGFGTGDDDYFWILRNSFGKSWGEEGYMRMQRAIRNMCGISTNTILPFCGEFK